MASEKPPEEQEQMIRAKKRQLFEADEIPMEGGPRKPFKDYVRDIPAAPLSGGVKAALWAAGVVIVLILLAALLRPRKPPRLAPKPAPTPSAVLIAPGRPV